ncbi:hypothetical protein N5J66_05700 [Pseudomonas juntendi]|uniref:hypothetical protein n=1 Tax=Pseudomonas juntendi TaxID=2666183 RepID=UPI000AE0E1F4|nr:hypothetical protein [Pseudomonas juntendi]MDH2013463.1 hypothetical protein [Pseudomonas juntendi]
MNSLWLAFVFAFYALGGWVGAHESIKNDCDRIGGFYIGNTIYNCTIGRARP